MANLQRTEFGIVDVFESVQEAVNWLRELD